MKDRISVKFGGQSGQGINTLGGFVSKALKNLGYHTFAYREYPSIIKGGYSSYQIDFSSTDILSPSKMCDILICISDTALEEYLTTVRRNGVLLHSVKDYEFDSKSQKYIKNKNITTVYIDSLEITERQKAHSIMSNVVMLGSAWQAMNLDIKVLESVVINYFSNKKDVDIQAEKKCLEAGYSIKQVKDIKKINLPILKSQNWSKSKVITGNEGIALGAIAAGCRAYYAYPMTPATSILEVIGDTSLKTHILVKQAESEITAAQMVMGSMYMGARAFTATSGGGFDLMTESISFSGVSEIPLVIVLGQRAGSGTGVPTWTGSSDLNVALYSGHGEFPKCVMCASDALDSFELIQDAFNISDRFQIPVILLTEKHIAESIFNISKLPGIKRIDRGLSQNGISRYIYTNNGISPRWIPQSGKNTYLTNSDEHDQKGISTEEENTIVNMSEKRIRKLVSLKKILPEPKYYGNTNAKLIFVGMGSSKNAVLDAMKQSRKPIGYLHYKYIYPFKKEKLTQLVKGNAKIVLIENNQSSGLGKLIKEECNFYISNTLNKFDGRPFFVDDILEYLRK